MKVGELRRRKEESAEREAMGSCLEFTEIVGERREKDLTLVLAKREKYVVVGNVRYCSLGFTLVLEEREKGVGSGAVRH